MTILETDRLIIEEASFEHCDFIFSLLNSPNWLEYIGDRGIKTMDDANAYIQNSLINSYTTLGYGLYLMILKDLNTPIGMCGFLKRDYLDHPDIGFAILPEYERMGYTLEAARSLKEYGEKQLGIDPVLAITSKENRASQAVLNKIGLTHIGNVRPPEDKEELMLFSS